MSKINKKLIIVLSLGMLACGVAGVANVRNVEMAQADIEAKFEMIDGAAVRIAQTVDDESGIRWTTTLNKTFYDTLNVGESTVELGVLVAPEKNIAEGTELTISTPEVDPIPCTKAISFNADGEFTYYSSIVYDSLTEEQALKAYAVELTARAYIKVGEKYTYVDEYNTTRSMRAVAYDALNEGYTESDVGQYFGDVQKTEDMSGYYSGMDAEASLTNVNELANGTYSASVKAQPVEVVVDNAVMTVSGKLNALTAGENYELNVFDSQNNVYVQNFMYTTLVIDEASDLNMFHLGGKAFDGSFTEADKFDGYYILAKNIDMTDSIFKTSATITDPNSIAPKGSMLNVGLTGTFDGNGYRIYNFDRLDGSVGLFAAINGGTVKNVSISSSDDVIVGGGTPYLAGVIRNATFDNVYIKVAKRNGSDTSLLARAVVNSTFKNCLFEAAAWNTSDGLFTFLEDYNQQTEIATKFENCYVVCSAAITHRNSSTTVWYEASNMQEAKATDSAWDSATWLDGIKRYETVDAMIADVANNNYNDFNENYWDTTSGMPVWKVKTAE